MKLSHPITIREKTNKKIHVLTGNIQVLELRLHMTQLRTDLKDQLLDSVTL